MTFVKYTSYGADGSHYASVVGRSLLVTHPIDGEEVTSLQSCDLFVPRDIDLSYTVCV